MSAFGIYFGFIAAALLMVAVLLCWALQRAKRRETGREGLEAVEPPGGHLIYFRQIRQALDEGDLAFVASRGKRGLAREVKKERRRVLLSYLDAMRGDFGRLIRLARVIAVLSPELAPAQEWERLRLTLWFSLNVGLVRARLRLGLAVDSQLNRLSLRVSDLAMRIEGAMTELGERAALASELASALQA
jgi:hypothetical protein